MVGRVWPCRAPERKVEHLARLYHRSPAKGCVGDTTNRFWLLLTIKQPKWGRIRCGV
jgi:hypothetical protein